MTLPTWTFEMSRAVIEPPGYAGDYGTGSAIAATESEARALVYATYQQPYDDLVLVAGDLCRVEIGGKAIWENWGGVDNHLLSTNPVTRANQRSRLACRALRRWRQARP